MVHIEGQDIFHPRKPTQFKEDKPIPNHQQIEQETVRRLFAEMNDDEKWGFIYQMRDKFTPKQLIATYQMSPEDVARYFPHGIDDPIGSH